MFIECVAEETESSVGLYVERLVRMLLTRLIHNPNRFPQTPSGGSQNQPVVHEADVEEPCRWHQVGEHQRTLTMRDCPAFDPSPQRAGGTAGSNLIDTRAFREDFYFRARGLGCKSST